MVSLDPLFRPKSIAVIGASREPASVGYAVVKNILESKYTGKLYPVNPKAAKLFDLKCYKSVKDIPGKVDLAIISVPAKIVPLVVKESGQKGVRSLIIISAGFKEIGTKGAKLEEKIVKIARKYKMPMLGPNVLGLIDTGTPMNASFVNRMPYKGSIGFISQSGALCSGILDWSVSAHIGFSKFISLGNKADITEVELIEALGKDPATKVILVYIESVANGTKFLNVTRRVTKEKPVIILKGGKSIEGARAASSHTGSLAGKFVAYEAAFKQTGVLLAENTQSLFDLALSFATQPLPEGRKTAIITNAGGPGILATDSISSGGLELTQFSSKTVEQLRKKLPPTASFFNPVDLIGDAKADRYSSTIEYVIQDENVDNIIVLLTMQAPTEPIKTAKEILRIRRKYPQKPIVAAFIGGKDVEKGMTLLNQNGIPCFSFPHRAVNSLLGLCQYAEYLRTPPPKKVKLVDVDKLVAREVFDQVYKDNRVNLLASETTQIAKAYGIKCTAAKLATNIKEAKHYAEYVGYPLVMKIASPDILHKTDIGGVVVGVNNPKELEKHFIRIMENAHRYMPRATLYGVTLQTLAPKGHELIIGMSRDLQFGPLIMFGLGGIYVNFLKDVAFKLAPLSTKDAHDIIKQTKAYTLLQGIRGEKPSDVSAIVDMILRISQLVTDFPEIVELDINPLFVYEKGAGAVALDIKITLQPKKES